MTEYIIEYDDSLEIDMLTRADLREEIIRCMDCVWFKNSSHYGAYCTNFGSPLGDDYDGFCKWGERKSE